MRQVLPIRARLLAALLLLAASGCASAHDGVRPDTLHPAASDTRLPAPTARTVLPPVSAAAVDALEAGRAWLARGDTTAALAEFERAATLAPNDPAPWVDIAHAAGLLGDHARATAAARTAVTVAPMQRHAVLALIQRRLADGDRQDALGLAIALTDRHPDDANAWYALGQSYWSLLRTEEATDALFAAKRLAPDDLQTDLAMLAVWARMPAALDGAPLAARLQAAHPDHPDVLMALAVAAEVRGDLEDAVRLYLATVARQPSHAWAHHNLAKLLDHLDRRDAAVPHLEAFITWAEPAAAREVAAARARLSEKY